jgi:hypothetical protein
MKSYKPKQYVELFHLLFLNQLGRKIDKKLFSVKGGCNVMGISFSDFKGQVIAYLEEDDQSQYDDESVWNKIIEIVLTSLEQHKHETH